MFTNIRLLLRPAIRQYGQYGILMHEFKNINLAKTSKQLKKQCYNIQPLLGKSFHTTPSGHNKIPLVEYEEVKSLTKHPEKLLIDVREPQELQEFGKIPASINIPLANVPQALSMNADNFKQQFGRDKPSPSTEIIFHCKSGRRSAMAAEKAVSLGYKNVKNYAGSWNDWAQHNNLPK